MGRIITPFELVSNQSCRIPTGKKSFGARLGGWTVCVCEICITAAIDRVFSHVDANTVIKLVTLPKAGTTYLGQKKFHLKSEQAPSKPTQECETRQIEFW